MINNFFDILKKKYNINLNEQQQSAVLHKDGPAVILAVPGAGKTTVLISRTANLIMNSRVNPENILSITFSKASAKDMKERFNSIFAGMSKQNASFSTIHSFAYFLLRDYAASTRTRYTLIEGDNSAVNKIQVLKEIYYKVNKSYINDDKLEELINTIGYVKNMMLDVNDSESYDSFQVKRFNNIFTMYEAYKRNNNYIDFDDMLTLSLEILKNNPMILNKYRNRYKYIQVDEGQDTSNIQNEIIRLLAHPNNNIFVVADDDQSIYGFRGASPESLLNFKDTYKNAKIFFMEENFRSTNNIVTVSNQFIMQNISRYKKQLFTNSPNKRPVTIVKVKDEDSQYDYIVKELKQKKVFSDTAILYRNNISSIGLIENLTKNNIPFYMRDTKLHFFKHWVVQDILCFFNLALDNCNISSFEKIYFKMKGYISKASIKYIMTKSDSKSVFDRLISFPEFRSFQIENIKRLKHDFKVLAKKKPYEAITFIEYELEYTKYLQDNSKNFGYSYENIKSILSCLKIMARDTNSIIGFIAKFDGIQNEIEKAKFNKNKNAVVLSTIHSAKGLEFNNVYMVDLVDGEFPSTGSIELFECGNKKAMEEERRLFYVGMTRAKEVLDIITLNNKNGEKVFNSRFVSELERIIAPTNEAAAKQKYKAGVEVIHKKFGKGKIRAIEDNSILIAFDNAGIKQLSLNLCYEKNLLQVI